MRLIPKKGSTLHDFPYRTPERKCFHCWIINVTPPGPKHCIHSCVYCYARESVYSDYSEDTLIYDNLPELVEKELKQLQLCPPISLSNVSDPCQDIAELRREVQRLVQVLMSYGVAFSITTKGDPAFLLEVPGFIQYEPKFIAITIEGTAEVLQLLSPGAPPFELRVKAVTQLSQLGIRTLIRFDPVFPHLFQALYGESWRERIERVMEVFAATGARHIICSTGRLYRRSPRGDSRGMWQRLAGIIRSISVTAARRFEQEYRYERGGTSQGYLLRRDLRREFHRWLRAVVEREGLTYATCQELTAEESDSPGIPHCEGLWLPFSKKQPGGRFQPLEGCTANCHVTCAGRSEPPCGCPELATWKPYKPSFLRRGGHRLWNQSYVSVENVLLESGGKNLPGGRK